MTDPTLQDAYDDGVTINATYLAEGDALTIQQSTHITPLVVTVPGEGDEPAREVLRIEGNGDIFVNGRLAANDETVIAGLMNTSLALVISRMGAWEKLCEPCRRMLRCEDAAQRLGKPTANKDDASIEAEVRERLANETDPTSSLFVYEGAALLRMIDRLRRRIGDPARDRK